MRLSRLPLLVAALLATSLLVTACGGGGGGSDTIIDTSPGFGSVRVQGLTYETPTHTGVTGPRGEFEYEPGEVVEFRIGDTVLGSAPAKARMTALDLCPGAVVPLSETDLTKTLGADNYTPEARLFNLLIFLQTIDADGDLENGILIPSEVSTLLTGVTLDFDRRTHMFHLNPSFRRLLRDGVAAGLWGGAGCVIRNPRFVLGPYFRALGIAHHFALLSLYEVDDDMDGIIDFRYSQTQLDENTLEQGSDTDGDGVHNTLVQMGFNLRHDIAAQRGDEDVDGVFEHEGTLIYDAWGRVETAQTYVGGLLDYRRTWQYSDLGYVERETTDDDGDGILDRISTTTYNAAGLRYRVTHDNDADGATDEVVTYTYDSQGHMRTRTVDEYGDGIVDSARHLIRDAQGRVTLDRHDHDGNGTYDEITRTTYDDVARTQRRESDRDADGLIDDIRMSHYDVLGRRILYERDHDADGLVDRRTTWRFDATSETSEFDADADGLFDTRTVTFLNEAGEIARIERDMDGDGIIDQVETRYYTPTTLEQAIRLGQV